MKQFFKIFFFGFSIFCHAQTTSTILAGSLDCDFSDGITGVPATFSQALGIATDLSGNIYVADTGANCIRKITADGSLVSTISGLTQTQGATDGTGIQAKFFKPSGIATDLSGNIYVADTGNSRIRKITPSGVVSTFAGSTKGYVNGIGTIAKFYNPYGLTVDSLGNVYVADRADPLTGAVGSIRKITPSGVVSDFYRGLAYPIFPLAIAIDSDGNFYVSDLGSNGGGDRILKLNSNGVLISTLSIGSTAYIMGITIDSNKNIYVTTSNNAFGSNTNNISPQVRKITPSGYVTNEIVSGLLGSFGITVNNSNELFIADSFSQRILKKTTGSLDVFAGVYSVGGTTGIKSIDGMGYPPMAHFNDLKGVATDSNGNIYVVDKGNYRIRKITPSGYVSTLAGSTSGFNNGIASQALFCDPIGITIDNSDNIYIIENYNCDPNHSMAGIEVYGIIRKITPNGIVSSYPPNNPDLNLYNVKGGIVIDKNSNIYVTYNNRIRKVTPNGVFSDFAGTWDSGYINGQGVAAKFNNPTGLAIDPSGNIYVADTGNSRIRKITPSGVVSTLAANSNQSLLNTSLVYNNGFLYIGNGLTLNLANEEVGLISGIKGSIGVAISKNDIITLETCQIYEAKNQTFLNIDQNSIAYPTINLFPNPVKNTLYLRSMSSLPNENFVLYDSVGKILSRGTITNENFGINVEFLSRGIYFIKLGANSAIKFIKE